MGESLFLMIVGMVTVFTVLCLVVVLGNVIIRFVNRFLPEEVAAAKPSASAAPAIDPKVYSAICSAVSTVTGGKGSVVDVKKL
ncbi:MAG: OadG family protein [Bacteroidales bacterium]|nr:OadG family protein [Bacteroidales bacterium]